MLRHVKCWSDWLWLLVSAFHEVSVYPKKDLPFFILFTAGLCSFTALLAVLTHQYPEPMGILARVVCSLFFYLHCVSVNQWPHNPATGFRPPSATVVSAEPFSHGTWTLRCLQKEMATYRHWSVSLWRDPDDVSHCWILSPDKAEWRLISAALCGWGHCFVADQLWLMTCVREEEEDYLSCTRLTCIANINRIYSHMNCNLDRTATCL